MYKKAPTSYRVKIGVNYSNLFNRRILCCRVISCYQSLLYIVLSFNFHPSIYQVSESAGSVDLNVSLNGHLGRFTAFLSVRIDDSNTLTTARGKNG